MEVVHLTSCGVRINLKTTALHLTVESPVILYIPLNSENSHVSWGTERCSEVPGSHSSLFNTYLKDKGRGGNWVTLF